MLSLSLNLTNSKRLIKAQKFPSIYKHSFYLHFTASCLLIFSHRFQTGSRHESFKFHCLAFALHRRQRYQKAMFGI